MLKPVRIQAPELRCVSVDEIKSNLHIEHGDDDALIYALVLAAESHLDGFAGTLNRCLMQQTWRIDACRFEHEHVGLEVPGKPVVVVKYLPPNGGAATVPASDYHVLEDSFGAYIQFDPAFVAPDLNSAPGSAWVEVTSGAALPADVPAAIRHAIILIVSTWYELRGVPHDPKNTIPAAALCLLAPFRRSVC